MEWIFCFWWSDVIHTWICFCQGQKLENKLTVSILLNLILLYFEPCCWNPRFQTTYLPHRDSENFLFMYYFLSVYTCALHTICSWNATFAHTDTIWVIVNFIATYFWNHPVCLVLMFCGSNNILNKLKQMCQKPLRGDPFFLEWFICLWGLLPCRSRKVLKLMVLCLTLRSHWSYRFCLNAIQNSWDSLSRMQ